MIFATISLDAAVTISVSVTVSVGLFIAGLVVKSSQANRKKIEDLALDVRALQTQISPFWSSLQSKIAESLHHPGPEHKTLDNLLEKLIGGTLAPTDKKKLITRLKELRKKDTPEGHIAGALLVVMPMALNEKKALGACAKAIGPDDS
jgi:hypothetical protein